LPRLSFIECSVELNSIVQWRLLISNGNVDPAQHHIIPDNQQLILGEDHGEESPAFLRQGRGTCHSRTRFSTYRRSYHKE
jgi:hypothetical protein